MPKTGKICLLLAVSLGVALAMGCASSPAKVTPQPAAQPLPPALPEQMDEIVVSRIEDKKEPQKLVTFSLREADIREVLLSMSKILDMNIVMDPDVSGKITVEVKRVTPEEALDSFLTPLFLQYKKEKNYIAVSKMRRETRVFTLNYITARRAGTTSVVSTIGIGVGTGGTAGGGGGVTSTLTADPWADIETGLKAFVSEGGKMVVNRMAGSIIVADYPQNLNSIAKFLEEVEGSVHRQVMIQALVVDVTLSDEFRLGLNWSAIAKISALNLTGTLPGGFILGQTLAPSTGSVFQIGMSNPDFSALLNAMAAQGKVDILSSPRISVLNNQKAVIRASRAEVYYEVRTEIDPVSRLERISPTPRTVDVGVVLEVVPQISPDGQIIMDIHPVITDKVDEKTFESASVKITTPVLAVRETNSVVKTRNGQTIILGGLIQERRENKEASVPGLGSLPLIGSLFRKTEKTGLKTEIVVLITPTVITGKRIEDLSQKEFQHMMETIPDSKMKQTFMEDLSRSGEPAKRNR